MALYLVDRARKVARWAAEGKGFVLLSLCLDIAVAWVYCRRMSIATLLIDATVDAVRETDRQLLDAMKRAVLFDTTAMQQWYDQRDYDAMRRCADGAGTVYSAAAGASIYHA